jgi:hypothetical protein
MMRILPPTGVFLHYRDHIDMYLSEMGYSELVQRLFEKMTFFLVDPLILAGGEILVFTAQLVWVPGFTVHDCNN